MVVGGIATVALLSIGLLDLLSPGLDISSCPSDNLSTVAAVARDYMKEHGPALPADVEVFRRFMRERREHDYLYCNRSRRPLVWRPSAVNGPGGGIVLAMCPPGSHGVVRRYAWALVVDGMNVNYAIVRGHQLTLKGRAGL